MTAAHIRRCEAWWTNGLPAWSTMPWYAGFWVTWPPPVPGCRPGCRTTWPNILTSPRCNCSRALSSTTNCGGRRRMCCSRCGTDPVGRCLSMCWSSTSPRWTSGCVCGSSAITSASGRRKGCGNRRCMNSPLLSVWSCTTALGNGHRPLVSKTCTMQGCGTCPVLAASATSLWNCIACGWRTRAGTRTAGLWRCC